MTIGRRSAGSTEVAGTSWVSLAPAGSSHASLRCPPAECFQKRLGFDEVRWSSIFTNAHSLTRRAGPKESPGFHLSGSED